LFKNTKTTETKKYSEVNNLDIIKSYRDERVKEIRRQISDFYSHYKQLENKYVVALTQYNEWQKLSDKKISEMICKKINANKRIVDNKNLLDSLKQQRQNIIQGLIEVYY